MSTEYDVIVIGAGHAGCESAVAAARMGCRVAVVTLNLDKIAHLPCNCSIGGPAKGHLAREVDALGGAMGVNTDHTLTHIRYVGTGKGPAVQTLRAHADKALYPQRMRANLTSTPGVTVLEAAAEELLSESCRAGNAAPPPNRITGVKLASGEEVTAKAVIVTTGTFLNGLMHCGEEQKAGGRVGEANSTGLSGSLVKLGLRMGRFKTGTTPRIDRRSIDFTATEELPSEDCPPFSFLYSKLPIDRALLPCWQTRTTTATHDVIRANLLRSAMYGGRIAGIGPRYCPSIEDKVVRFADKESHPVFLEQETWDGESVYVQGMSTSLPADVQLEFLRTVPGLQEVGMIRPGYAVEYDVVFPDQLSLTLGVRCAPGLFLAGQINGTSGYEEAAAQGLVAGANAALMVQGRSPLVLGRQSSYIGVLIDDLVAKGVSDPYRMLTGRAEYRLLLRHDNADERLTPIGHEVGLIPQDRWDRYAEKRAAIAQETELLASTFVHARDNHLLERAGTAPIVSGKVSLAALLRRPELTYNAVAALADQLLVQDPKRDRTDGAVAAQVEIRAKYAGYIERQSAQVAQFEQLENVAIPNDFNYDTVRSLSHEAREKLLLIHPISLGQASRIPGLRPGDIQLLYVYIVRQARALLPV